MITVCVSVCDSSFHHEHAVISHCLLCLLVAVTPGYFCCRGIYTSSLSSSLSLFIHPSVRPTVCQSPYLTTAVPCVSIYTVYKCVCTASNCSQGCVCRHCRQPRATCLRHAFFMHNKAGFGQPLVFIFYFILFF